MMPAISSHRGVLRRGMTGLRTVALLLALGLGALLPGGCDRSADGPRVLLIGVDGADWALMGPMLQRGELPHFQQLMWEGIYGPLTSYDPLISPLIWTTIATGKGPDAHGVLDFTMPDPATGTPIIVTSQVRRSKAFWNILSESGLSVCVVGWWATWPAEAVRGAIVSDRFSYHAFVKTPQAEEDLVYPAELLAELRALEEAEKETPYEVARQFMQISEQEYAASAGELDFKDPISHFRHIYRTMAGYAAIAKYLLREIKPDVLAVYFEGVDTAGHMYMRYTPPPYPHTTAEERRKFGRTVEAFYRYQDRLLGELLEMVDERTTVIVVSDHGFLTGRQRPIERTAEVNYATAARWHRQDGVIIARGPEIRRSPGEVPRPLMLSGATVFDVTPTLLALLGLPSGSDMEGRVLTDMLLEGSPLPAPIPSYENDAWREERTAAQAQIRGADPEMIERLRSLGYIGADESDATLSLRGQWSLADYYMHKGEVDRAAEQFAELARRAPDWSEPYYHLGLIHMRRDEMEQAREMYLRAIELAPEKTEPRLNLAYVYRRLGEPERGIALLREAIELQPYDPMPHINLGILYRETGRLDAARQSLEEALRLDPHGHGANVQAAMLFEEIGDLARAARHWAAAVRVEPRDAHAQERLQALREQGYEPPTPEGGARDPH